MTRGKLLLALLLAMLVTNCQRLSTRVDPNIMSCGPEYTPDASGFRYLKVKGIAAADNVSAAVVSENGEQRPLTLTSKGCLVLPVSYSQMNGWIVVRDRLQPNDLAVVRSSSLATQDDIPMQSYVQPSAEPSCPKTPGFDAWYGRPDQALVIFEQAQNSRFFRYRLNSETAPKPLELSLVVNLQGLKAGTYELEFTSYDLGRIPDPIETGRKMCQLHLDAAAPEPTRKPKSDISPVAPGELIEILAKDESPYHVRLCWQEGHAIETSCALRAQEETFIRAPQKGDWTLAYQFEDAAGNVSKTVLEKYSVVDQGSIEAIESSMRLYQSALDNSDTISALFHLTSALKKRQQLQSQGEQSAVHADFIPAFLRLGLSGVARNKILLPRAGHFYLTRTGFLIETADGDDAVVLSRFAETGQSLEAKKIRRELTGFDLFNARTQEIIESSTALGFKIYDSQFSLVDTIALPAGESMCWRARFDKGNRYILVECVAEPYKMFLFDRVADRTWKKVGVDAGVTSDEGFVGDASSFVIVADDGKKSFLFSTRDPAKVRKEIPGNWNFVTNTWQHWTCARMEFKLHCFDHADPDQDHVLVSEVESMVPKLNQRFISVERQDKSIAVVDMEKLSQLWPDKSLNLTAVHAPSAAGYAMIGQDREGDIISVSGPQGRVEYLFIPQGEYGEEKEIPEFMGQSELCGLVFFRYADHVLVSGVEPDKIKPNRTFKVAQATKASCLQVGDRKRLAFQTKSNQVYVFTYDETLALQQDTPDRTEIKNGEAYVIVNHGVPHRIDIEEQVFAAQFVDSRFVAVADVKGSVYVVDTESFEVVARDKRSEGGFMKIVALDQGSHFALFSLTDQGPKLIIYQKNNLKRILERGWDKTHVLSRFRGNPHEKRCFIALNDQVFYLEVDDLIHGIYQPHVFTATHNLLGSGWDETSQRMFAAGDDVIAWGDASGHVTQTRPLEKVDMWAWSPLSRSSIGADAKGIFFMVQENASEVIKDLSFFNLSGLRIENEVFYMRGNAITMNMPLDENWLLARSCTWLKDYLANAAGLTDPQRSVCD